MADWQKKHKLNTPFHIGPTYEVKEIPLTCVSATWYGFGELLGQVQVGYVPQCRAEALLARVKEKHITTSPRPLVQALPAE